MARLNEGFRSNESPMDFQYTDGRGPVSADSPFAQAGAGNTQFKDNFAGQKHSATVPGSPSKFATLPATRNLSFTIPQTPQKTIDTDFSSGPEQSSPANADSEATPDPPARSGLSKDKGSIIPFVGNKSEKKAPSHISGRGQIARIRYDNGRVEKKRKRNDDKDVRSASRRASEDSDFEERPNSGEGPRQKPLPAGPPGTISSILSFIDAHPNLPGTLSYYIQFFLNCFFAFCLIYVLYVVYSTISSDIDEKVMLESSEILAEMAVCARDYSENKCEKESRVPAMEIVCNNWERCMQRDPYKVGRSRLSAGMFAEIFNSFIEPISLKAIIVSISVIVGCFAVNNLTFGLWRARTHNNHPPPPHTPYMHPSPQQPMGWPPGNEHYYTPHQNRLDWQMQGMGHGGYQLDGQSPTKRLGYR
ncbi:hypothetical protein ABVK25_003281 [Lepraria finkii]|uniref:Brl1/Brr6 domain-containing protein n=1 Tax=Lepraria finkii TaxID=1340010 RepID=A0ABR4BJZ5_9LECA